MTLLATLLAAGAAYGQSNGIVGSNSQVNYAPVGNPQEITLTSFDPVVVTLTGYDANGDPLVFSIAATPEFGSLGVLDPLSGKVTYTPPPQLGSSDSLSFVVSDGTLSSDPMVVTIHPPLPSASFSTLLLDFGNQPKGGTSSSRSITVQSGSAASLNIEVLQFSGTNGSDFGLALSVASCANTPPLELGESCTIAIRFTPSGVGARSATLVVSDNAPDSPQSVELVGVGVGGLATLSPTILNFPNQTVGSSSAPQIVALQNTGNADFAITSVSVAGSNKADFTATSACGAVLVVGNSCTVGIVFKPSAAGARAATLNIRNAVGTQSVALTGQGVGNLSVSPASLGFGNQGLASPTASKQVTIKNNSAGVIHFTSFGFTGANGGDFSQSSTTCGATLDAHSSCSVGVTFTPSVLGSETGSISIVDDAANSPQVVALSGKGLAQTTLAPGSLSFGSQATGSSGAAKNITVTNNTSSPITMNSVAFGGANPADFVQTGGGCAATLAGHSSCVVAIAFSPTATGKRSALAIVASSATNSPQSVNLAGTGIVAVSVTPASLTFSSQKVGNVSPAKPVTLKNNLPRALSISNVSFGGQNPGDFAMSTTCGTGLASGGSCAFNITFQPSSKGMKTAVLTIADDATGSPQTVTVTGSGK